MKKRNLWLIAGIILAIIFVSLVFHHETAAFYVSPASGNAPLSVTITTNRFRDPGGRESMDYGDGTTEAAHGFADPHETHNFNHTYSKPGTYTITFFAYSIYDKRDPTYANKPQIFQQPGAQPDPYNKNQILVPRALGSQTIVVN